MKFCKMNGAGNDFIIINNMEENLPVEEFPGIARCLCTRKLSLGADGLMAVLPAEAGADFKMLFYNSDGSLGEMCGNGARCICRYGYENGLSGQTQRIETTAGPVTGVRLDKRNYRIELNAPTTVRLNTTAACGDKTVPCDYMELGRPGLPHAIVRVQDLGEPLAPNRLQDLGRLLRMSPDFPKGANVNFYEFAGPDELNELTFERGVEDFTLACGSGTGSVVAALTLKGLVSGKDVRVNCQGGTLYVSVTLSQGKVQHLYLTGPTNIVAVGEIKDDCLVLSEAN